jgi:hypothetical protein
MKIWNNIPPHPHLSLDKNSTTIDPPKNGQIKPNKSNKKVLADTFQDNTFGRNLISNNTLNIETIALRNKKYFRSSSILLISFLIIYLII